MSDEENGPWANNVLNIKVKMLFSCTPGQYRTINGPKMKNYGKGIEYENSF